MQLVYANAIEETKNYMLLLQPSGSHRFLWFVMPLTVGRNWIVANIWRQDHGEKKAKHG